MRRLSSNFFTRSAWLFVLLMPEILCTQVDAPEGIAYNKTIFSFGEPPFLYAGGSNLPRSLTSSGQTFSLARLLLTPQQQPALQGIAYPTVQIGFNAQQPNPLLNQKIAFISQLNGEPAVVLDRLTDPDLGTKVYLLVGQEYGAQLYTHNTPLKDANNQAINKPIAGITGAESSLFVAVPARDYLFSEQAGLSRGIAVLEKNSHQAQLDQKKPATKINLTATGNGALGIGQAAELTQDTVALCWSQELQRLFVGLQVKRSDNNQNGGVVALLVGRFDSTGTLLLEPLVNNQQALFAGNSLSEALVGYYAQASDPDGSLGIRSIQVAKTTTGFFYLIISAYTKEFAGQIEGLYAIPILGKQFNNQSQVPENLIGKLAKKDFSAHVLSQADLPQAYDPAVRVGAFFDTPTQPCIQRAPQDFFVQGDTVYSAMGNSESRHVGLIQSTALFNEKGHIIGWTPAARTGTSPLTRSAGAGLDWTTGGWYCLTEDSTKIYNPDNLVEINPIAYSSFRSSRLTIPELFSQLFPQEQGGIYALKSFDRLYPTFNTSLGTANDSLREPVADLTTAPALTLFIATGNGRIALVQSGKRTLLSKQFYPLTDYKNSGADQNLFFFHDAGTQGCGAITTAAISQKKDVEAGWLFIAGNGGVAVLRNPATGYGFTAAIGLENLSPITGNYPGAADEHSFKLLTPSAPSAERFKNIRKLVPSFNGMNCLTGKVLYWLSTATADANKFFDSGASPLNEITIAEAPGNLAFNDLVIAERPASPTPPPDQLFIYIFATTEGLFVYKQNNDSTVFNFNNCAEIPVNQTFGNNCLQLHYCSDKIGYDGVSGQLYLLVRDRATVKPKIALYRYAIDPAAAQLKDILKPVGKNNGLIKEFTQDCSGFFITGNLLYQISGKHFDSGPFIRFSPLTAALYERSISSFISTGSPAGHSITLPIQEPASGSLIFAGDWGMALQQ